MARRPLGSHPSRPSARALPGTSAGRAHDPAGLRGLRQPQARRLRPGGPEGGEGAAQGRPREARCRLGSPAGRPAGPRCAQHHALRPRPRPEGLRAAAAPGGADARRSVQAAGGGRPPLPERADRVGIPRAPGDGPGGPAQQELRRLRAGLRGGGQGGQEGLAREEPDAGHRLHHGHEGLLGDAHGRAGLVPLRRLRQGPYPAHHLRRQPAGGLCSASVLRERRRERALAGEAGGGRALPPGQGVRRDRHRRRLRRRPGALAREVPSARGHLDDLGPGPRGVAAGGLAAARRGGGCGPPRGGVLARAAGRGRVRPRRGPGRLGVGPRGRRRGGHPQVGRAASGQQGGQPQRAPLGLHRRAGVRRCRGPLPRAHGGARGPGDGGLRAQGALGRPRGLLLVVPPRLGLGLVRRAPPGQDRRGLCEPRLLRGLRPGRGRPPAGGPPHQLRIPHVELQQGQRHAPGALRRGRGAGRARGEQSGPLRPHDVLLELRVHRRRERGRVPPGGRGNAPAGAHGGDGPAGRLRHRLGHRPGQRPPGGPDPGAREPQHRPTPRRPGAAVLPQHVQVPRAGDLRGRQQRSGRRGRRLRHGLPVRPALGLRGAPARGRRAPGALQGVHGQGPAAAQLQGRALPPLPAGRDPGAARPRAADPRPARRLRRRGAAPRPADRLRPGPGRGPALVGLGSLGAPRPVDAGGAGRQVAGAQGGGRAGVAGARAGGEPQLGGHGAWTRRQGDEDRAAQAELCLRRPSRGIPS
mmetsp:Transcript_8772/g.27882  ORF Transcript_8772/g.27882 Transcript_8772/m.27882 type:complete len:753 (+) Transcript_8772:2-2260(+)